ncbi:MAG TPA: hypothetical protein VM889_09490 [Candidatus Thermoplasmatota archaeon]|nr:hypothetical protein [Candidatus Thermoplasmatota archaeon]
MTRLKGGAWLLYEGKGDAVGEESWEVAHGRDLSTWRSTARRAKPFPHETRVTLTLGADGAWRALAFEVEADGRRVRAWEGRPGATAAAPWRVHVTDREGESRVALDLAGAELDGPTPLLAGATLRRLGLAPGEERAVETVVLAPVTLEPARVARHWSNLGPAAIDAPTGRLKATRWRLREGNAPPRDVLVDADGNVLRIEGAAEIAGLA